MKIYVAHNFAARLQLREDLKELARYHYITSRWIYEELNAEGHFNSKRGDDAQWDVEDIDRADTLVLFVDQFGDKSGKGKFWEWGYALASGKRIFLVGQDTSCVFYHLEHPNVLRFENLQAVQDYLAFDSKRPVASKSIP